MNNTVKFTIVILLALTLTEEAVSGEISVPLILITIAKAAAFLVIGALLGRLIVRKLMVRLDCTNFCDKYPESIFIAAIMTAFFYSLVAELVGLSAIIGSFLAGVSLTRVSLRHDTAFQEGAEHLQIIFASIFFISLGVLLVVGVITTLIGRRVLKREGFGDPDQTGTTRTPPPKVSSSG